MTWPYLPPLPCLACDLLACHWVGLTAAQIVSYFSNSTDKTQGSSSTWAGLVSLLYMYFLVSIHLIYTFICWAYAYTGLITVSTLKKATLLTWWPYSLQSNLSWHRKDSSTHQLAVNYNTWQNPPRNTKWLYWIILILANLDAAYLRNCLMEKLGSRLIL